MQVANIPDEIKEIKQWSYSYSTAELKRPLYTKYKPNGALTALMAMRKAGVNKYVGFYVTKEDPYILLDIDKLKDPLDPFMELPPKLAAFLRLKRTYCELSPSGKGLRIVMKLEDASEKQEVNGQIFYTKEEVEKVKSIQMNFSGPWMTITGNVTPFSQNKIATTSVEELSSMFQIKRIEVVKEELKALKSLRNLPSKVEVQLALSQIPLDQNARVKRAFKKITGEEYTHYDFWMKVMMALHHYAELTGSHMDCLDLAIEWSEKDREAYSGEDDVVKHWTSLQSLDRDRGITYRTLFKLALECDLKWPKPRKQSAEEKKYGAKRKPLVSEYANFETLLRYYDLRIFYDVGNPNDLFVCGDDDIVTRYFRVGEVRSHFTDYHGPLDIKECANVLLVFAQDHDFSGISIQRIRDFLGVYITYSIQGVDFFKMYFETPFDQLPKEYRENEHNYKTSTFDQLWSCIEIDYQDKGKEAYDFYRGCYKKWLFGLFRSVFYNGPHQGNNCILLLTGPEQIRKTSHFRYILPPAFRYTIAFTTHGFSTEQNMRDIVKITAISRVVVWDELEQYIDSNSESNFKKVIDGLPQKFIDKYEVRAHLFKPIAIYGATSNRAEFKLGSTGSRRIFHIPVKWVDTDKMDSLCWHPLLLELKAEFDAALEAGEIPWLLTEEELHYQARLHIGLRAKNNIDMMLDHVWDFEMDFDNLKPVHTFQHDENNRLLSINDVRKILARFGYNIDRVNMAALRNALDRACTLYTDTMRSTKKIKFPKCTIRRGIATQGQHKRYVLPPIKDDAQSLLGFKFEE